MKPTELKFSAEWHGEPAAGINSGYEEITIQFKYGHPIDPDVIEYWQQSIKDFYDGAYVELMSQSQEE